MLSARAFELRKPDLARYSAVTFQRPRDFSRCVKANARLASLRYRLTFFQRPPCLRKNRIHTLPLALGAITVPLGCTLPLTRTRPLRTLPTLSRSAVGTFSLKAPPP